MGIHLRRPTDTRLRALLTAAEGFDVTYAPIGISAPGAAVPHGFRRDAVRVCVGRGDDAFAATRGVIASWGLHRGAGMHVLARGEPTVGTTVAISAPLPLIGHVDITCRVVDVVDEADRHGFTYGTLPVHPEVGEESFTVGIADDGTVAIEIVAVWRPRHPLSRIAPPITRILQRRATERYVAALRSTLGTGTAPA